MTEEADQAARGDSVPEAAAVLAGLMNSRRSTRAFRSDPVPREVIAEILRMAQSTPSWCNTQPWHLTITEGDGTERFRNALYERARSHAPEPDIPFPETYEGVYRDRRREAGMALYAAVGIAPGDREASAEQTLENFRAFGAPHVAVVTTEARLGTYGAVDCGLFVQSFLLAAQSFGLATIPQAALAAHGQFVRDFCGIPDHRNVVCGISFGYADTDHPVNKFRTSRIDLPEDAVQWIVE